jgi:hypothetical protein
MMSATPSIGAITIEIEAGAGDVSVADVAATSVRATGSNRAPHEIDTMRALQSPG